MSHQNSQADFTVSRSLGNDWVSRVSWRLVRHTVNILRLAACQDSAVAATFLALPYLDRLAEKLHFFVSTAAAAAGS